MSDIYCCAGRVVVMVCSIAQRTNGNKANSVVSFVEILYDTVLHQLGLSLARWRVTATE